MMMKVLGLCVAIFLSLRWEEKRKEGQRKPISEIISMCFIHCRHFSLSFTLSYFILFLFLFSSTSN